MSLFRHKPHPHKPVNVNEKHKQEQSGINQKIAVALTNSVGTMWCAYVFTVLAILGYPGFQATPTQWVQWISQTLIQLVMLSVIMVGQKVIGRHQELQSDEQFSTTQKIYHDIEQIIQHQSAQDEELLRQTSMLVEITGFINQSRGRNS